jgi:DNA-cytosine methyltransferase
MKVLSLFDGVSGGMLALKFLGIKVDKYYASEIDDKAISVSRNNFPEIKQVGDIKLLRGDDPRFSNIDLVIAGSPCTNLSVAGNGKGLKGEQSMLFFEFIRLMREVRPRYFLLENVASMKKVDREAMTAVMKDLRDSYFPQEKWCHTKINSSVMSVQSRDRLYWTNIDFPDITHRNKQCVADILEGSVDSKLYPHNGQKITPSKKYLEGKWESDTSPVRIYDIGNGRQGERIYSKYGKSVTVTTSGGGPGGKTGLYLVDDDAYGNPDDHEAVVSGSRRLTPIEAERLQRIPDNYTKYGCDGQEMTWSERYGMLGNGFTISVVAWILNSLRKEYSHGGYTYPEEWRDEKGEENNDTRKYI